MKEYTVIYREKETEKDRDSKHPLQQTPWKKREDTQEKILKSSTQSFL